MRASSAWSLDRGPPRAAGTFVSRPIRALPYLPGKKLVLDRATKGVRQAVNAIALEQSPG